MSTVKKLFKFILLSIFVILLLLAGSILLIRSSWGQSLIVQKASSYVSDKTNTTVEIGRLFVTFSGNIQLDHLFLNDTFGDTLIYSDRLEASLAFIPLILGQKIHLNYLEWDGLKTNLQRKTDSESFNFQFLIDAFATNNETTNDTTETSKPLDISIGQIELNHIEIKYNDQWLGLESKLLLQRLSFEANKIDLQQLAFEIETLALDGTVIDYKQTKAFAESNDSKEDTLLPFIQINNLSLNNVKINYQSIPDNIKALLAIGKLQLDETGLDLKEQKVLLKKFQLDSTSIQLITRNEKVNGSSAVDSSVAKNEPFEWPKWEIELQEVSMVENKFYLQSSESSNDKKSFNPESIKLDAINLQVNDIHYLPEHFTASLNSFSFQENNQFKLQNLAFNLDLNSESFSLSDLQLLTTNNAVQGNVSLEFNSLKELLENQKIQKVKLSLPSFTINPKEVFYFLPELKKEESLMTLSKNDLTGQLELNGNLEELKIPKFQAQWGDETHLAAKGIFQEVTDLKKLYFSLDDFIFKSTKNDILQFVSQKEIGIEIPQTLQLYGSAKGNVNDLTAKATLEIPEGKVMVNGAFANKEQIVFDGTLTLNQLEAGKLLNNPQLGTVTMSLTANGRGKDLNSLNAKISSQIDRLQLYNYDYSALTFEGDIKNGKGNIMALFKDENLNASLNSSFQLDSSKPAFDVNLEVVGADLYALQLTEKKLKTALQLTLHYEGKGDAFEFQSSIRDNVVVFDDRPYSIGSFDVKAKSARDTSSAKITSEFLTLDLAANVPYKKLFKALEDQFMHYLSNEKTTADSTDVRMSLELTAKETPLITEIISDEVRYDSIQMSLNFDQKNDQFSTSLTLPSLSYQESKVDQVQFSANGNKERLQFSFGFSNFNSDPIEIPKTILSGELKDKIAYLDFNVSDLEEKLIQVKSELQLTDSAVIYHINPEGLILNNDLWSILPENELLFSQQSIRSHHFELSRNENKLTINSSVNRNNKEVLELIFDNFQLATFTNFLSTSDTLASGIIKGSLAFENPMEEMGIISNLRINELEVLNIDLGKLQLNAKSQGGEQYFIDLSLKGKTADLDFKGDYIAKKTEGLLDFNFKLNTLELAALESLSSDYFSNLKGSLSATANLKGTTENPKYQGKIDFKNTSSIVNSLNAPFKLPDESITFSTNEIVFNNFLIQDSQNNAFRFNGKIFTDKLLNPTFDLDLKASRFQLLNSTVEDNELFYGTLNLNADVSIKGDLNVPIIRGRLGINEGSSFTYVVPEEELDIMERDGVVVFVNKKNPDAILTRTDEDQSSAAVITGYDLNAILKVDKNVDFKIVVDQRSGDNLKIKGNGDFKFGLEPNGRTTLSGRYEVQNGYYEASLYNIVKRRFDIANGSSIVWRGNPFDADMDIRAIYQIETSALGLMASKTSNQGVGVVNEFRQKLPFLVYLNLDGELLKPRISFQLDMPEESKGQLGGQVYARVQQLNSQEEELNKQVFSLLVLNQFFPTTTNDGSGGGSAAIARGNVNKVLEDQLNNFSGKYLKNTGLELDFGVDSYTDYQGDAPQSKTQLDVNARKKLFNDKLIVQVGSGVSIEENSSSNQQNTPVVGNISLEYLITENGRWRLKGFRKNEFESVIEGQLIVTGISLIFQREFNQFRELVNEIKKHEASSEMQD